MFFNSNRTTSLAISLFGAVFNFALAARLLGTWRSFKWESESEWESSEYSISKDGVRLVWALLCAYFAAASAICFFGLAGIIRGKPSFVRIYRDYIVGDFVFGTLFAAIGSYAAFRPTVRSNVCELLSRQPDMLRDFIDLGLTFENCEPWFERGVFAFMVILIVITVIRLHFVLALSSYYTILVRHQGFHSSSHTPHYSRASAAEWNLERIYILPVRSLASKAPCTSDLDLQFVDAPVYAPVPLTHVSPQVAEELLANATEAWVSRSDSTQPVRPRSLSLARHQSADRGPGAAQTADLISLENEKA
ncbi:hypothetical protein DEU56DRAFT_723733 [Suillus clintonianus]|uniref:uncharacterized protein n=1 Tax=Suillus clintonianus TaxID=1904413 RepID=UPI001B8676F1|nr:uncharacterized protein DEU56DRAFT_723733 [Suillus clintonianus]KAG2156421.1 hypothetical protein DEU56DRAFT_723733 [Suillus clintonianus]